MAIPAGISCQVRLRFVPNQPAMNDRFPERNGCGSGRFNCVVAEDGRIQPLLLDGSLPELRITSDRIEGSSLPVSPDTDTDVVIELKPGLIVVFIYQRSVCLLPVLTGSAKVGRGDLKELGAPENGVVHDSLSR